MANVAINANFVQSVTAQGQNNSYYKVGPSDSVWLDNPSPQFGAPTAPNTGGQHAVNMAARLCALTTDTTNGPGFATPSKPVIIHCLAFGAVLEPSSSPPPAQAQVMQLCQQISTIGGTRFPASNTDTTDPDYYKLILGDQPSRTNNMKKAFMKIMDSDIPVSIVK